MTARRITSSDKMSRSIESKVEADMRNFLAQSGAPAIASIGLTSLGPSNNHFDGTHNSGGLSFPSHNHNPKMRSGSADSPLLPPINKSLDMTPGSAFLDSNDLIDINITTHASIINDDDDEVATQIGNRRILENLTDQLQQMKQQGQIGGLGNGGAGMLVPNIMNTNRKASQKLVSGTQFRIPQREPVACSNCEHFDRSNRKLKEANRMLRLQVTRLEEKIHDLRRAKADNSNETSLESSTLDGRDALLEHKTLMKKQLEGLEAELAHWKKKYVELDQDKVVVDCSLVNAKKEVLERSDEINRLKQLNQHAKLEKDTLEREFKLAREKFLQELDLNNRSAMKSVEELAKCEQLCKQLKDELDILRNTHANKLDSHTSLESAMQALAIQLRAVETERDKLKEKFAKALSDLESAEKAKKAAQESYQDEVGRNRSTNEDGEATKRALEASQAEAERLRAEIAALRAENKSSGDKQLELVRRMTADSESTKQALERAITSSVRLCVVAPTVNVHIPPGKMNLKSSVSESGLKDFLSTEVLAKYTFLFKQRTENASPEEGLAIQAWVEQMLKNMQTAIESHVYRAIEGAS